MSSIVDTHCHLDLEQFESDREQVVSRALSNGVHAFILIGYNPEHWRTTLTMCDKHSFMRRAVGVHPNDASIWNSDVERQLIDEIVRTSPLAIGEIGIDLFRSNDNCEQQEAAFASQVKLAREADLPVIIHQRGAEDVVLSALEKFAPVTGVMHCFTGDTGFARRCVDLGLHLGIGGVATFPKSDDIREAVAGVPMERLLLETDAPFLAPQIRRGKRNEPAYLGSVAERIASVLEISVERVAQQTTENAISLFGRSLADAVESGSEYSWKSS